MRLLSYYRARFQHPGLKDFASMGLGIEARYLRCKEYWKRHLELSQEFQTTCLATGAGSSVALYGAGRLLDVPKSALERQFKEIHFFDADPTLVSYWQAFRTTLGKAHTFEGHLAEITGVLGEWTGELEDRLRNSGRDGLREVKEFLAAATPPANIPVEVDCSISLNILSQLGIYWRERFEALVRVHRPEWVDADDRLLPVLEQNLAASIQKLEEQHLQMLAASSREMVVLITDAFFLYYQRDQSLWQEERALEIKGDIAVAGFTPTAFDTWFWHIAPQGIEHDEHGAIHQVQARCFRRCREKGARLQGG